MILSIVPPARQRVHRPNGKVARLPLEMRNLVNQALRDGRTYRAKSSAFLPPRDFRDSTRKTSRPGPGAATGAWLCPCRNDSEAKRPLSEKAQAILGQLNPDGRFLARRPQRIDARRLFSGIA